MKKKTVLISVLVVVILICSAIGISAAQSHGPGFRIGQLFQTGYTTFSADPAVAAVYHGVEISEETVRYYRDARSGTDAGGTVASDQEIIEEIVENLILTEEAESRGLAATEEEIDAKVEQTRQWYEENEDVRAFIDDFCEGAGMQAEDYFAILREQAPASIARAKLTYLLEEEWCDAHNVVYDAGNPPEGMTEAVEQQLDALIASHMDEIEYMN